MAETSGDGITVLIVGATGLVGSHVFEQALADPAVARVIAPTRRPLPPHEKLLSPQVDFNELPTEADWWRVDAVICTLGTTIKTAGSQLAFRRVDHDYPLDVARLAKAYGASTYALTSAIGADAKSRFFYNRVKGEVENELKAQGFTSLTIVRPGIIGGKRPEFRLGERLFLHAMQIIGPLLPRQWRVSPAGNIARALLNAALSQKPGVHIIPASELA
ncbi:oxidoreductase [Agrobacterium sp.]|uniref:oxidoreductase n=1 Tax=Agrobacterium sp. TaxID=361 RepID=UPI0028A77448|nr:oxidoreductase [Agrobacterium sp.]